MSRNRDRSGSADNLSCSAVAVGVVGNPAGEEDLAVFELDGHGVIS